MTTIYSSNFDSTAAGSLPAGWVNKIGIWAARASGAATAPNCLANSSGADGDVVLYTGSAALADMDVSFSTKESAGSSPYAPPLGVILRSDAANANHYVLLFSPISSGNSTIEAYKKIGGSYTAVGSANFNLSLGAGDVIRVRATAIGSTISVYVGNGAVPSTPTATFTDTSITAAGYSGFYYSPTVGTMGADDFVLADFAAAAAPTVPGAPTLGTATAGNGSATFPYTAPSSDGGSSITGYSLTVYYADDNGVVGTVDPTLANPIVAAGLVAGRAVYGKLKAINGVGPGPASAASNSVTPTSSANNALLNNTAGILFSPANWDVQASSAKTINAGAKFSTVFGGTSCTLNFDVSATAGAAPQLWYRVNGYGAWNQVLLAASVAIAIPGATSGYSGKPGHLLEVVVKSTTESQPRWAGTATAVKLTGIVLDAGCTISAPGAKPLRGLFFGDSITEGVRTVKTLTTPDTDCNDSMQGWAYTAGQMLGAEVGIVGFGASGLTVTGSGSVPPLPSSYNLLYQGVARSFANLDFVVLMEGTNDGTNDVTSAATAVLNGLLAANGTLKIVVLRPFDGIAAGNGTTHAGQLQAAIAACSAPARVTYVNTAGWFTTANSSDQLHPYGVENITHIAPLAAAAIRSAITTTAAAPATTARTFSVTLDNGTGAAANLAGLSVAFYDQATPGSSGAPVYKTESGTTNASGVLTGAVQSTLAAGGTGRVEIRGANGTHYNGPVQVS